MARKLTYLLLVFAWLFAQHAAIEHGFSHVVGEEQTQNDRGLPHACDECLAYAGFSGAISRSPSPEPPIDVISVLPEDESATRHSRIHRAYASRAPPLS